MRWREQFHKVKQKIPDDWLEIVIAVVILWMVGYGFFLYVCVAFGACEF